MRAARPALARPKKIERPPNSPPPPPQQPNPTLSYARSRLEPQYAIFGQSAGVAAVMAARGGVAVQDVSVAALQAELRAQGQLLDASPSPPSGGPLRLAPCGSAPQRWSYCPSDGSLRRAGGGGTMCVSVWGYANTTGEKLVAAECHTNSTPRNQAFDVAPAAGGGGGSAAVLLRSRMSGLCAARSGGAAGAPIVQAACGDAGARWAGWAEAPASEAWMPDGGGGDLCVSDS